MANLFDRIISAPTAGGGFTMPLESSFVTPLHLKAFTDSPNDSKDLAAFGMFCAMYRLLSDHRPTHQLENYDPINHHEAWALWDQRDPPTAILPIDFPVNEFADAQADYNAGLALVHANRSVANQIIIDLLVASSNKDLTSQNYKSYCAMKKGEHADFSDVRELLRWGAVHFEGAMESAAVRAKLTKCDWIDYHTSFASVGSLCNRMFDLIPKECTHIVSTADRNAALASKASPWSRDLAREISARGLAFTEIAVRCLNLDIGEFYAGKKALSNINPITQKQFEELIKQLIKKDPSIKRIKASRYVDDILVSVVGAPDSIKSKAERERTERRSKALDSLNRKARVKAAKKEADDNGTEFLYTLDMVTGAELDAVDEEEL